MVISQAYHAWAEAKKKNDFAVFAPKLDQLLDLVREETQILGYEDHPYDALLDQYEPGIKVKKLDALFSDVTQQLVPFVRKLDPRWKEKAGFLKLKYNKDCQWQFGIKVLKGMGYDFEKDSKTCRLTRLP